MTGTVKMGTAIIFGANGQDGHYLAEECRIRGLDPVCISRSGNGMHGSITDYNQVSDLIKQHQPEYVFHLAANSTTRHDALFENHATISTGTLNVLESVRLHCPTAKVFITGSGLQFVNTGKPISEHDPFEATSPYSVARIQSVYAARYYRSLGLQVYVGYLFHHESPLRKPNHVSQKIAMAVQRISKGSDERIELGDISVVKEWTFAKDVVKGIFTLVGQNNVTEAAIGSGKGYSIEHWLQSCFRLLGKDWKEYVTQQQGFKSEYPLIVSDPETINALGWKPEVAIEQLAEMMVFPGSDHA